MGLSFTLRLFAAAILALTACTKASALSAPAARGLLLDVARVGNALVAVGERGSIARSIDSGRSWDTVASPTHATLTSITFADHVTGYAAGHDGTVLATRDAGQSWSVLYVAEDRTLSFLDLHAFDNRQVLAVGSFGTFAVSRDGAHKWNYERILDEDLHFYRLTHASEGVFYLAGERGTLLRFRELGGAHEVLKTPYEGTFHGVLPVSPERLLAYGLRGHIFRSDDAGETWTELRTEVSGLLATAIRLKSGVIMVGGAAGILLVSLDDGLTFYPWPAPLTTGIAELIEAPDGTVIAAGEAGVTRIDAPIR